MKVEKIKTIKYSESFDLLKLELDITRATVHIAVSGDNQLKIERLNHSHIIITEQNGVVKLKQIGSPLFHPAVVKISVPPCCVPDITANIKQGSLDINGGIYGDVTIRGGDAKIDITNCAMTCGQINVKTLSLDCEDISARQYMSITSFEGNTLIDNSFCTDLDVNQKSGNIGISNLKCHDSSLSVEKGGINLILNGYESEYNLMVYSKHGMCNRENTSGARHNIKAYADYGNITIEFSKIKEAEIYGNDNVTEDTRLTLGA